MTDTRLVIEPTGVRGERGCHYRVLYAGQVVIWDTWNPEYDAARALVALGVTGTVEVWRDGKVASTMDIERVREVTISGERAGWTEGGSLRAVFSGLGSAASGRFGSARCPGACGRGRPAGEKPVDARRRLRCSLRCCCTGGTSQFPRSINCGRRCPEQQAKQETTHAIAYAASGKAASQLADDARLGTPTSARPR